LLWEKEQIAQDINAASGHYPIHLIWQVLPYGLYTLFPAGYSYLLGGKVSVESELHRGTTVNFTIPVKK